MAVYDDNKSPFNDIIEPIVLNVTIKDGFVPSIVANADYQGWVDFKLSLNSYDTGAFSKDCEAYVDDQKVGSCSEYYHTVDYFDSKSYTSMRSGSWYLEGIQMAYDAVQSNFCLLESDNNAVCTTSSPLYFYSAARIYNNYWSRNNQQTAGILGLDFDSTFMNEFLDFTFNGYHLQFSNFTDLSFA